MRNVEKLGTKSKKERKKKEKKRRKSFVAKPEVI
jgi:hypothetical protein